MSSIACRRLALLFGSGTALEAAQIRHELETERCIGPYDVLIAGQARQKSLTIVTRNLREFRRLPHLKVTDWTT